MHRTDATLTLTGEDLDAARSVVGMVFANEAFCGLSGDFDGEFEILLRARPLARLFGTLGYHDSHVFSVDLTRKEVKRLRKAAAEARRWVEFRMRDWLVDVEKWESPDGRRVRDYTRSLLVAVERVEGALID